MCTRSNVCPAVKVIEDLLSRERRSFQREICVLMDPVPWDGDRRDVSIPGYHTDLADYEVVWNGRNPNSAWTLDRGMVWPRWGRKSDPVKRSAFSRPGFARNSLDFPLRKAKQVPHHLDTQVSTERPISFPILEYPDLHPSEKPSWYVVYHQGCNLEGEKEESEGTGRYHGGYGSRGMGRTWAAAVNYMFPRVLGCPIMGHDNQWVILIVRCTCSIPSIRGF